MGDSSKKEISGQGAASEEQDTQLSERLAEATSDETLTDLEKTQKKGSSGSATEEQHDAPSPDGQFDEGHSGEGPQNSSGPM